MYIKFSRFTLPVTSSIVGFCISTLTSTASPLISIGDNADVYFNGSSNLRWTSNLFSNNRGAADDFVWTLSPGFELNVGRGLSNANFSVVTRYDILEYDDNDQLDTDLFHITANGSYKSSRLDISGSVYFDENQSNSGDQNLPDTFEDLIEFDTYGARFDAEYRHSLKFSVGSGVRYSEKEYKSYEDRFADRDTLNIPLDIFYELTPKVDMSLGYAYTTTGIQETEVTTSPSVGGARRYVRTSSYEQDSHFFNVGARGNLLPKLTGFFKVGYRTRSSDDSVRQTFDTDTDAPVGLPTRTDRDDSGMLGLDADLTWSASPKLQLRLGLSRDFGIGGEGQTIENTTSSLTASYSISSRYAAFGKLGYTLSEYSNRDDDQYSTGVGFSFTPNEYFKFSSGYDYTENDSDLDAAYSFDNHSFYVSASVLY